MENQTLNSLTKEDLKNRLAEIEEQENAEMIAAAYPTFEKLIGKCYKSKDTYGCGDQGWPVYKKVVSVAPEDVYMIRSGPTAKLVVMLIEVRSDGTILINPSHHDYVHGLNEEIPASEFRTVLKNLFSTINEVLWP